jgi:hypothetical protein
MAAPEDNVEHTGGKLGGHGVGIAMIAIFAGMAFVVAFAASDGAIFGQNFQSAPSEDVPVSDSGAGDAVTLSRDAFDDGPAANNNAASTLSPQDRVTLSAQERALLALNDFPWDLIAESYIASNQDALQRLGQQSVTHQRPMEPGTEPLSLSDEVAIDVDRERNRERDDSDGISLAEIIEIDNPIADGDEERLEEDEQPDDVEADAPEDDQEVEPQDDENDQEGSGDETDDDSSGEGSGGNGSESGSDEGQSGESGNEDNSDTSNSTDNLGPSENSSSTNEGNDTGQ